MNNGATPDAAETWGSRVGKTLGFLVAAMLIVNLLTDWFF